MYTFNDTTYELKVNPHGNVDLIDINFALIEIYGFDEPMEHILYECKDDKITTAFVGTLDECLSNKRIFDEYNVPCDIIEL